MAKHLSEAEAALVNAMTMHLVAQVLPSGRELDDDEALRLCRNAGAVARALVALGVCVEPERVQ